MKNTFLLILVILGNCSLAYSQTYLDESGHIIDATSFNAKAKAGGYEFVPLVENGKLKSLQLKRSAKGIKPGFPAPDFTVTDITGKQYSSTELLGRVIVLNFWFVQCAGCIKEIPDLNNLVQTFKKDSGVVFLGVTFDPTDKVTNFLSGHEFQYNIVAEQTAMIKDYGINVYPTTIVIDSKGKIAYMANVIDTDEVQKLSELIRPMPRYFPL